MAVIQNASTPPPEYQLLETLLSLDTEEQMLAALNEKPELITEELSQLISALVNQTETQKEDPAVVEKLKLAHRLVLRLTMQANLAK